MKHPGPFFIEKIIQKSILKARSKFDNQSEFDERLRKKFPKLITSLTKQIAKEVLSTCESALKDRKKRDRSISKRIASRYGTGLKMFGLFLELNQQIGQEAYDKYYRLFDTLDDHQKLDTLIEIHARACQVALEIKLLTNSGFADGAHARWRTLHELSVTFLFLYDHDYTVLKMYNDYQVIESLNKAKAYQKTFPELGWDPLPVDEIERLEALKEQVISEYGRDFAKSYGWTKSILPISKRNFKGLEESVEKGYLRGIYLWANDNIHSGASGNKNRIGLPDSKIDHFLNEASEFGIFDPIQFTSYSIMLISEALLSMEDSVLNQIYLTLLENIQHSIIASFEKTETI